MNQQNTDFLPWDQIPEDNVFPDGFYHVTVALEDGQSSTGKRMLRGQFTCKEPAQFASMSHFENYTTTASSTTIGDIRAAIKKMKSTTTPKK